MKVRDLLVELQYSDPDAEVMVGYDYGDYWHTTVFERPENACEASVVYSDRYYKHQLPDDEDLEDGKPLVQAFVISTENLEGDM